MIIVNSTLSLEDLLCKGLNPEQNEAVTAPSTIPLNIMAGAGTGKTELIARRFVKLVMNMEEPDIQWRTTDIWVSTFTEKAASEMKERINSYLMQLTEKPLHPKAWIGTFHSLCYRILQEHGGQVPHLKDFILLSDLELEMIQEDMVKIILAGQPEKLSDILCKEGIPVSPDCLAHDNLFQLDLGDYEKLFEEIIFNLVPCIKAAGFSPKEFYHNAMKQTSYYARLIMDLPILERSTGAFFNDHETFAGYWTNHLEGVSDQRFSFFPSDWEIEIEARKALRKKKDPPDILFLLREKLKPLYKTGCFVSYNGRKKKDPFSLPLSDFSSLKNALALEKELINIVSATYALYQTTLRDEKVCDYDDLIQETIRLLLDFPEIREFYQNSFTHFMVDEFQDSNGGQLQLVKLLSGLERSVTAVGDKKQSIYGFRFAEPENLELLFKEIPDSRIITLKTNYRSSEPILAVANRITEMMELSQDQSLLPSTRWQAERLAPTEDVVWFNIEGAESIAKARELEVQWIAESVSDLLVSGEQELTDIAILVRDHRKALKIEEALESMGIPAIKQRNLGFFSTPVIQQAMALLELADNPNDDVALINLLQRKLTDYELYLITLVRDRIRRDRLREETTISERVFEKFHAASSCKAMRSRAVIKTNQGPNEPCELGIGAQNRSLHVVNEDSSTAATQQMPPKETPQTPSELSYYETLCELHHQPGLMPEELKPLTPLFQFLIERVSKFQTKKEELNPSELFSWIMQVFPLLSDPLIPNGGESRGEGQKALKQLRLLSNIITYWLEHSRKALSLSDILLFLKRCQDKNELRFPVEWDQLPEEEKAVRIMTIHAAKGLEFPVMFLAGTDRYVKTRAAGLMTFDPQYSGKMGFGLLLNRFQDEKTLKKLIYNTVWKAPRSMGEELRLFYVAVTRAKSRLFISSCAQSFPYMNPDFFRDLPVRVITPDEVAWKSKGTTTQISSVLEGV